MEVAFRKSSGGITRSTRIIGRGRRNGTGVKVKAYVDEQAVYDVHEHHMPEILRDRDVGLLKLLEQSYAGWTQRARPNRLAAEPQDEGHVRIESRGGSWDEIAAYVEGSGSNAFVRTLVAALSELYRLGDGGITRENWEALDEEIHRRHADPGWTGEVLAEARIERIVTDPYTNPLLDARAALGDLYRSVLRVNALALGWHAGSLDHNGNSAHDFARRLGVELTSFDDYAAFLERIVETMGERNQIALKNALAYDRDLRFDEPDEAAARCAWLKTDPSVYERKAFGDFVIDRLCALAGERGIPVQMHVGTALIRGSHPLNVAALIERHPRTRFLLMHLGYPWSRDVLGMAFFYRNIWLDLTWSFLLSPSHFKLALHEAIEVLPDESRLMLGGDAWHAEETYGALRLARRLIAEVLEEKIDDGYLDESAARRLARRILHGNARAFFGLLEASPLVPSPSVAVPVSVSERATAP